MNDWLTPVGWLAILLTQLIILYRQMKLQNSFSAGQEKLRQVNPKRLEDLDIMRDWVLQGWEFHRLARLSEILLGDNAIRLDKNSKTILYSVPIRLNENFEKNGSREMTDWASYLPKHRPLAHYYYNLTRHSATQRLVTRILTETARLVHTILAKMRIYHRQAHPFLPDSLPVLLQIYEHEVLAYGFKQLNALELARLGDEPFLDDDEDAPLYPEHFDEVYATVINSIEKCKDNLAYQRA